MHIIDGKKTAIEMKHEIANAVRELRSKGYTTPHLAAVLVGDDPASQTYVKNKEKACFEVGFTSSVYKYSATITEQELLDAIAFLNNDDEIDGFIVQLPLPEHISVERVIEAIKPEKDVDCFHPVNVGRILTGNPTFLPATPYGIMQLLERANIETEGKHCVVIGRSNIVGSPLALMISRNKKHANATVTLCHSKTKNLAEITRTADILVVAIGQPEMITANYIKEGAVVIDVGIHRIVDEKTASGYRLTGDIKYEEVSKIASYITPVPGGVGPMTIVGLLQNTLNAKLAKVK